MNTPAFRNKKNPILIIKLVFTFVWVNLRYFEAENIKNWYIISFIIVTVPDEINDVNSPF